MFHVPAHKSASAGQVRPAADVIAAAAIQQGLEVEAFIADIEWAAREAQGELDAAEAKLELWAEMGGYKAGLARPIAPWERIAPKDHADDWADIEF